MIQLPLINVVGVGMAGAKSLSPDVCSIVESADVLVGSQRHLDGFDDLLRRSARTEGWRLDNFDRTFEKVRSRLQSQPKTRIVILASGDPLFFGLGRLLLTNFPAKQLAFYPHISSIQLAFSRLKQPWQNATLISVHGRGEALLLAALKRGDSTIALLTDSNLTPGAIAQLIRAIDSPAHYQLWVCENLGSATEKVAQYELDTASSRQFAPLNVVVLCRQLSNPISDDSSDRSYYSNNEQTSDPLPLIGLPDSTFYGFPDRPTLMTKREIRLLILGELSPADNQVIWDIGAGTGSVSVELSRLCPKAHLYAVEKTTAGAALIAKNAKRLAIAPINIVRGSAPAALSNLPDPDRVFIGGSSGQLLPILDLINQRYCDRFQPSLETSTKAIHKSAIRIVIALATAEHLAEAIAWAGQSDVASKWTYQLTQVNISRSVPVGSLTRFSPLNPVTLMRLQPGQFNIQNK